MPLSGLTLTQRLAREITKPVNPHDLARARLHLLDWAGCVCGALGSEVDRIVTISQPAGKLKRYAFLGNVLEMDDVHRAAILHPGPVVWPATLETARDMSATLGATLAAGVRGYEAMIAVGSSFDAHHYAHFHLTSTAGAFGSLAACGALRGFDEAQYVWGFGNAGSLAAGLWHMRHDPQAMTKQFHVAHAAMLGQWIAHLTDHGFRGGKEILEGPQGVYAAMTKKPNLAAFDARDAWQIHDVSFKPWAACRHVHPAIDATLALKEKISLAGASIRVETYHDALAFCDMPVPKTVLEAKFSLQHAVAIAVIRGAPSLADFEPAAISEPEVVDARRRVTVVESARHTVRYPQHFGATVRSGDLSVDLIDALGDPERPMTALALQAKASALMAHGKAQNADAITDWIMTAPDTAMISDLMNLMP